MVGDILCAVALLTGHHLFLFNRSSRPEQIVATSSEPLEFSPEYKILHNLVHYPKTRVPGYVNQLIEQCHIAMAIHEGDPAHGVGRVNPTLLLSLMELAQCLEPSKHKKLVQFLSELQTRTVTHPVTGEVLRSQGNAFFTDLLALG